MYLTVYSPAQRAIAARRAGNLFDSVFSEFFAPAVAETERVAHARIGLVEKADRFEVSVDVPGVKKEDIDVKKAIW